MRPPPKKRTRRPLGGRALSRTVLLCTEGKREKIVIDALKQRFRNGAIHVRVVGERGDPLQVVEAAIEERRRRHPDKVWVVFDRDDHARWEKAIRKACRLGFSLAVSNRCFELWGVLLHRDHRRHEDSRTIQRQLAELHKGYRHEKPPALPLDEVTEAQLAEAHERAELLRREAEAAHNPHRNPTTTFHKLVEVLRGRSEA